METHTKLKPLEKVERKKKKKEAELITKIDKVVMTQSILRPSQPVLFVALNEFPP